MRFYIGIKQFLNDIRHIKAEMKSLEEVKSQIETLKPILQERFNVKTIEIFGSYARNEASEKSDIDLLITYSTIDYDHSTVYALKNYLRTKLGLR
jgi:predicted nucleotidyltransferase